MHKTRVTAKELPESRVKELKENAYGILAECRKNLINHAPFTGCVAMNLDIVPVRDPRVQTAATDGSKIFFDIDFLSSLSDSERQFVFAHEVWHCLLSHFIRGEGRDHDIMNIATDLEVNQLLRKEVDGNGSYSITIPKEVLLPEQFNLPLDLCAEEYYELLMKSGNMKNTQPSMNGDGNNNGNGNEMGGNSEGKATGQFDKHITSTAKAMCEEVKEGLSDKYGKLNRDPDYSPEVKESQAEKMREVAISAALQTEKICRGTLPAHLQRFVKELKKSEVKWQDVLESFVTRSIGDRTTWNRPNRRFASSGIYLPSHFGESIKVGVILDTSGSTAYDIPKFLGEVNGLVKTFNGYSLDIIQIDTEVKSCDHYDDSQPLDLENTEFKVNGGGGTIIKPAFDYILDNELDLDCIVVFTDGGTETFTEDMDPEIPTLWLVTKNGMTSKYKFGEVCQFKND